MGAFVCESLCLNYGRRVRIDQAGISNFCGPLIGRAPTDERSSKAAAGSSAPAWRPISRTHTCPAKRASCCCGWWVSDDGAKATGEAACIPNQHDVGPTSGDDSNGLQQLEQRAAHRCRGVVIRLVPRDCFFSRLMPAAVESIFAIIRSSLSVPSVVNSAVCCCLSLIHSPFTSPPAPYAGPPRTTRAPAPWPPTAAVHRETHIRGNKVSRVDRQGAAAARTKPGADEKRKTHLLEPHAPRAPQRRVQAPRDAVQPRQHLKVYIWDRQYIITSHSMALPTHKPQTHKPTSSADPKPPSGTPTSPSNTAVHVSTSQYRRSRHRRPIPPPDPARVHPLGGDSPWSRV